ncbi:MAG: SpoIIE family protein phosphatase [Rhodospirillaceae bacterium]|nr:SpoIIE family protein phosphatase [Rhodospirillaceae bacterium]
MKDDALPQAATGAAASPPPAIKDQLALIAEMTREFTASHTLDSVSMKALERITAFVGAEASSMFLLDADSHELFCNACYGPVNITGLRLPPGTGIVGRAVQRGEGQIIRDVRKDSDFGAAVDAKTGFSTRSILVAPMMLGTESLGAIEIINKTSGDGLFTREDLLLLETLTRAAGLAVHNIRLAERIVEREKERHELELAAEIQRDLLPAAPAREFPVHGINIPARAVSGDFYDIVKLSDGRIWFNVGDVSGKGMNAALMMAKTSSLFRCLAKSAEDPGQLLGVINSELCETNSHGMFVTMVGGFFDPATGRLRICNAGHEPPLIFDWAKQIFMPLPADAPPLGIAPDIMGSDGFPTVEINLRASSLYVFTDGLTEATTFGGGMLGIDGARALIREHAEDPPDIRLKNITGAVRVPGKALHDDLTLLIVEDTVAAPPPPAAPADASPFEEGAIVRIRVPARPDRLKMIRGAAEQAAAFCGADKTWALDLVMAVDEACQNIIRHAYGGDPNAGDIMADFYREGDSLSVHLMDFAEPVDPTTIKSRELADVRPGGLGVHLIKSVTDDARFLPPPPGVGNLFKLTKRLPPKVN